MAVATNIFPLVRRVKLVSTMPRLVRNDLHENLCSRCSHFRHRDPARQLFPLAWTKVGQSGSSVAGSSSGRRDNGWTRFLRRLTEAFL